MSKAEELAAQLKKRQPTPGLVNGRRVVWRCLIEQKRAGLRLSLRDIEKATGMGSGLISPIERGTDPQLSTARRIAEFFGCSIEELWPEMV